VSTAALTLRVLLVDDNPFARDTLRNLLSAEPGVEVIGECADGAEALEALQREAPDLLFLDVDMPQLDGFGVLEAVGDAQAPVVVFVTAHEHYAIRAFEENALDYLVKPVHRERFRQALERARREVEERGGEVYSERIRAMLEGLREDQKGLERLLSGAQPHLERLLVKAGDRVVLLATPEIDWVEAEGNYVRLHAGRGGWLIREKISTLEERLDPDTFMRVHRSTIVNLHRVAELRPLPSGDFVVLLKDGTELKLSRGYRQKLAERVGEYV
jgi:two-component system, LytTR family, response regulator